MQDPRPFAQKKELLIVQKNNYYFPDLIAPWKLLLNTIIKCGTFETSENASPIKTQVSFKHFLYLGNNFGE